jgi:hypothetical protein
MKKALPFIIAGILVIGIGLLIGPGLLSRKESGTTSQPEAGQEIPEPEQETFTGKIKDALSLGKSMKCTWEKDSGNFGTAYIKGEKVYTDVTSGGTRMHSIFADNCTYWWEEGKTEGSKICIEPEEEVEEEAGPAPEAFAWETPDISYNCSVTVIADSKFNPPSGIEFTDLFEALKGLELPFGE